MIGMRDHNDVFRILNRQFNKALRDYHLINDGDKVLVALSGGKDSLFLLEMLARRRKVFVPHFSVEAVHIRMENISYMTDTSYLNDFCSQHSVPLHVLTTRFDVESPSHKTKTPCFLCSWYRRKLLFEFAQDNGFNKIALGHHMDDLIHTALMNECFQGRFDTMPVFLQMKKMPLAIIRPLCLCHESDIKTYAELQEYQKQQKVCPYEKESYRTDIKSIFQQMESLNPEARYSIWNALEREGKLVEG